MTFLSRTQFGNPDRSRTPGHQSLCRAVPGRCTPCLGTWGTARDRSLCRPEAGRPASAVAAMVRTSLTTLCLVPTRVLLHQWLQAIRAAYPHAIGCLGDGARELAPITVATFEGAYRNMERLGDRFDLLVVDEAHHFGTGLRDEALEMSIADARLGSHRNATSRQGGSSRAPRGAGRSARVRAGRSPISLAGSSRASMPSTLHLDLTRGRTFDVRDA